jgi:hypothetical protein
MYPAASSLLVSAAAVTPGRGAAGDCAAAGVMAVTAAKAAVSICFFISVA